MKMSNNGKNLLSYSTFINDRLNFRKSGTHSADSFNYYDAPSLKFFKIFFYFSNGDSSGEIDFNKSGGLLSPTWSIENINPDDLYLYNSAWSYLKMNFEDERADMLEQFVNLLSNINSHSPWYFTEIGGLDAALERKQTTENTFIFEAQRPKITIKCAPDSFDDRIGTLLDLYRAIVWSWTMKREVLPANLRKFDMGIMIFNDPVIPFHKMYSSSKEEYSTIDPSNVSDYKSSYKYIELHNCEIDYNSSKTPYGSISNAEGFAPEYTISISFDDCYEMRYNEFNLREFGDLVTLDLLDAMGWSNLNSNEEFESRHGLSNPSSHHSNLEKLQMKEDYYSNQNFAPPINEKLEEKKIPRSNNDFNPLTNAVNQVIGTATNIVSGIVKKAVLGNLYTFSLTRLMDQGRSLLNGDIWTTARNIAEYVNDAEQRKNNQINNMNLFEKHPSSVLPTTNNIGDIYEQKTITTRVKKIGNIFQSTTMANNI